jgi:DNA-binding NtrC family response regulator
LEEELIRRPFNTVVIDDEQEVLDVLESYLEGQFSDIIKVITFTSAEKALEYIYEENVHLVIIDINMPDIFGDTLLRKIINFNKSLPVVVVTGDSTLAIAENCHRNGARSLIRKPFTEEDFCYKIENVINTLKDWERVFYGKILDKKGLS